MKQRIGAVLSIVLGTFLIVSGTTSGGSTIGVALTDCGGIVIGAPTPACPTGHISITKVVVGTGSTAPAGGWVFTITSTNCALFPGSSNKVTIPAAGGTQKSDKLYSTENVSPGTVGPVCDYLVTETPVTGWTTTSNPTNGHVTLGTSTDANDRPITFTNTASPPSTTPPPTSSTPTASVSPTGGLVNTGPKNTLPTTVAGVVLVAFGGVLLFAGRRRRPEH